MVVVLIAIAIPRTLLGWGWQGHRFINEHAFDYLPASMSFFDAHQDYVVQHSVDPDTDPNPGYYHYIDVDYYPEFFTGTLPVIWEDMVAAYGYETVIDNGTVPWVIDDWADSLTVLMTAGQWAEVWQIAAELGHYVADSHQALHLTLNYNGQLTGNYGIHSRYETTLVNTYLDDITLGPDEISYWDSLLDSVFSYIEVIYPYVAEIIEADDFASGGDPSYGNDYYTTMWWILESITVDALQMAAVDLASIWYTCWIDAGSPVPGGPVSADVDENDPSFRLLENFPNPFNPMTHIRYELEKSGHVTLDIYDIRGQFITNLISAYQLPGRYTAGWSAHGMEAGVYLARLNTVTQAEGTRLLYLK